MKSMHDLENIRARDRQMWQCHWHLPERSCDNWDGMMTVRRQETALHAAYEFVFRIYYSDMSGGDPIREGYGIVCVHNHAGSTVLVEVKWWLGTGLEGYSRLVNSNGKSLQTEGQAGLWKDAGSWSLKELKWGGLNDDSIGSSRYPLHIEEPKGIIDLACDHLPVQRKLRWSNTGRPYGYRNHGEPWAKKRVLLVEDNQSDIAGFEEVIQLSPGRFSWTVLQNGRDALTYLHQQGPYKGADRPDLLILNLNLPGMYGMRVLEILRKDPSLDSLPVLIWSISELHCDIREAYRLGISGYFTKPIAHEELVHQVAAMLDFVWWYIPKPCEQSGCRWVTKFTID
jgi:two-component system, chemotaxis family, response regulator Rcp1